METGVIEKGTIVLYLAGFIIHICSMFELYRKYFERLCAVHPELLHLDETGKKVFQMIGIEEAYGDFRVNVAEKGYIFRLITYTWSLTGHDQPLKTPIGGFIIAKYNSSREGGTPAFFEAMESTERLCDMFAAKVLSDSANGHPLFYYSANTLDELRWNASPLVKTGDGSYSGWLCTFHFSNAVKVCLDDAPVEWQEPTPHQL